MPAATPAKAEVIAGPIANPANDHVYYLLELDTWTNSEAEAVSMCGHLATINDSAEEQWVFDTFSGIALAQNPAADKHLCVLRMGRVCLTVATTSSMVTLRGEP